MYSSRTGRARFTPDTYRPFPTCSASHDAPRLAGSRERPHSAQVIEAYGRGWIIGFALGGLGETVEAEAPGEEAEARSEQADRAKRDPEPAENERKQPEVKEAGQLGIPRIIGVVEHVDAIANLRWRRRAGGGEELDGSTVRGCEADDWIQGHPALGIGFARQVDDRTGGVLGSPYESFSVDERDRASHEQPDTKGQTHSRRPALETIGTGPALETIGSH